MVPEGVKFVLFCEVFFNVVFNGKEVGRTKKNSLQFFLLENCLAKSGSFSDESNSSLANHLASFPGRCSQLQLRATTAEGMTLNSLK